MTLGTQLDRTCAYFSCRKGKKKKNSLFSGLDHLSPSFSPLYTLVSHSPFSLIHTVLERTSHTAIFLTLFKCFHHPYLETMHHLSLHLHLHLLPPLLLLILLLQPHPPSPLLRPLLSRFSKTLEPWKKSGRILP
uniref:Uncharacterized protein n=1 Tax=Opuntia streptacantha TaxID=393608 RepID=A0A7C8ZI47_OPUST